MRWLLSKLGLATVVWVDFGEGEWHRRIVRRRGTDKIVYGHIRSRVGILQSDGSIRGGCYLARWKTLDAMEKSGWWPWLRTELPSAVEPSGDILDETEIYEPEMWK